MATIGDSGAPSTNTIYYDTLLSTTLMAYRKEMVDNIFKDSAFLAYLRMKGAVKKQNGGERVAIPLMYDTNKTVHTHGGYDVIDTTPQEATTTAFYEWAEVAGSISISNLEKRQNSGEGRLIDLLGSKIKQAEMTMREKINSDLILGTVSSSTFVPDSSSGGRKGLLPLGFFCRKLNATDPTSPTTVGNISSASESWWRNKTGYINNQTITGASWAAVSVTTWAGLKVYLRRMYNFCSRGSGGSPNLVLMDQTSFETYENALDTAVRFMDTKMADLGFDTIKLRGATCIWDEMVPDIYTGAAALTVGTAFFLNTDFYGLMVDSETDIVTTPFVTPENQTASTAKILFMGQAWCSNLRKLGVLGGISLSIVS